MIKTIRSACPARHFWTRGALIAVVVVAALTFAPTSGPATAGLVAAFSFDDGSGSTVTDLSGTGNTGTISNTTWTTAGKYGKALVFNGTNARVNIADAASLHLTSAMTLEAWVNPSVVTRAWRDVIYKGDDNYYLEGTSARNPAVPVGGGTIGSATTEVNGSSALTANTWTHLAVTYGGGVLRLYVNGAQVASLSRTGDLTTSTNPLQIGGNSLYGQYFNGTIDEIRIYNATLSAAQIQSDMGTPVGGSPADTQPPTAPTNLVASAMSSSQINLSWTASSDNVGVTGYRVERCQGAGCTNFAQVATPSGASFSDTGLSASTSYSYRVRATDAAGNLSGYSTTASATTQAAPSSYSIGGTVSGLSGTVVLQNNGGDDLSVASNGPFTFGTRLSDGAAFNVTVESSPSGQTCSVSGASGTVASANVTNVAVACSDTSATPGADDFDRADGGLGPNWADIGDGGLSISSHVVVGSGGGYAGDIRTGETYASDQYSQVEVTSTQLTGGQWIGPAVRAQNGGQNTYLGIYFWNNGNPILSLYKRSAGNWIQLGNSYNSGPLAAGTKLKLIAVGSRISFLQDGVERIAVSDISLTGGAPGIIAYGAAKADNWSGGTATSSGTPGFQIVYRSTDANGVASYDVTSADNGYGTQVLRVLAPTRPAAGVSHNFLYVLPVEAGLGTQYGDGLETMRALDAQDQYNLTIIEPTFGIEPWYADNPTDPNVQYETFMTNDLLPWVTQNLALTGHERNWLIGFSKSGIGGEDLILRHPDLFTLAASWDFPADMSAYDQFGSSSANSYGTDSNFQANYRLTSAFLDAHKAPFLSDNRIWIGGYSSSAPFQDDMSDYDALLTSEGIAHTTETPQPMLHRWDSGWVPIALAALSQDSSNLPAP